MKKILIAVFGLLLLLAPAAVQASGPLSGDGFEYTINVDSNTITVYDYTNVFTNVTIPSTISNLTVTVVGNGTNAVFSSSVLNVVIPNTVTSIGDNAFYACTGLTNVSIPTSVTGLGEYTFYECYGLTNVTLPESIVSIGYGAFESCEYMTNINFPASLTSIGDYAFEECYDLSNVVISSSVNYIGYYAFYDCGMTNLTIGVNGAAANGPCTISEYAFYDCYDLQNLVIGKNVASIGYYAFYDCDKLTNAVIGSGAIQEYAFDDLSDLASVTIGDGVPSIGYEAFYECEEMNNLTVGNGNTAIGYEAFEDCYDLTNCVINSGSIGDYAFEECEYMRNLTLGKGVTSIGYYAFYDCYDLTNCVIENGVIEDYAFEDCEALTSLTLGNGVTSIGYYAFEYCTNFTSLTIPNSVGSIGDGAFYEDYNLKDLTLGNSITTIPSYAFEYCYALKSVTFGPNLGSIGYEAFYDDTNLVGLYFHGNAPSVDNSAFYYDTNASLTAYYYAGAGGWSSTFYNYIPTVELEPSSLQVSLGPVAARLDGAAWQLDGGSNETAAVTTVPDITVGSHTVTFTTIAGWITPPTQTVTITNGESATIVGYYMLTNATTPHDGLVLQVNGSGTIEHAVWPAVLTIGKAYTVTAVPSPKNFFAFWTGGTNQPYSMASGTATYSFIMEQNLVLVANFLTNPFPQVAGTYNGIFSTTNGVTEETAGMLKGLVVGKGGSYSGTLFLNGRGHGISGNFKAASLSTTNLISRPVSGGGPVLVEMTLLTGSPSQLIGTVSGTNGAGTNAVPWTAGLDAYLAANSLLPAETTVLFPPDTNNAPPTGSPGGYGYLLITNNYLGGVKITGALADGTAVSETAPVSQGSYIPIYANLYNSNGLILGWLNLNTANVAGNSLTWIHPVTTHGLYQAGFTNVLVGGQILMSPWTNPPPGLDLLTNLETLDFVGDTNNIFTNITVSTTSLGAITGTGVSGSINVKTGLLKVTIGSGADKVSGYGAVLLNATNGGGYFLSGTNAEAIELAP